MLLNCSECNGTGFLPKYSHVAGGRCFNCFGAGHELPGGLEDDFHAHVECFQDALQIEHIHAWVDQDYHSRSATQRY